MKIINKSQKPKKKPQHRVGDLFEVTSIVTGEVSFYMLVKEEVKDKELYILRQVKDGEWLGANGHHPTPEALLENLKQLVPAGGIKHYPTHQYELHLKERGDINE